MDTPVAEDLVARFKLERLLNQDQGSRRISLLGAIDDKPALLVIERAALPTTVDKIARLPALLAEVTTLGCNDVYHWYMADLPPNADMPGVKLNLIYPCTPKHISKYSPQMVRMVTETPEIYKAFVRPYMQKMRAEGRLNWVYNIIEGRQEAQDIIIRESRNLGHDDEGFLLLPDMNWDRTTMESLRILGLVERRDLMSLRDLSKKDIPWLKMMYAKVLKSLASHYGAKGVEEDMLKVYIHYQPTYFHFHLHIVSVALEPNATQAVGKAFSLPNLISQLETMQGGPDASMADITITYTIGENHDLWTEVFGPLKEGKGTFSE